MRQLRLLWRAEDGSGQGHGLSMRLTHVTNYFSPRRLGGTEFYLRDLLREQSKEHKASVAFRRRESSDRDLRSFEENGYFVHCLNFSKSPSKAFGEAGRALFERVLDRGKPDIVHFHSFMELPYSLLDAANERGIPSVFTVHDFSILCPSVSLVKPQGVLCSGHVKGFECFQCHTGHQGLLGLEKAKRLSHLSAYLSYQREGLEALQKFDVILCPSEFAARKLAEFRVPTEKLVPAPFGRTLNPRLRFKSVGGVLRFGFIGELVEEKGIELLLKAFQSLKGVDAELDVYGNGEQAYEEHLVSLAGKRSPINFLGSFDRTYIDRVFERIDVLVIPTLKQETASLLLLEAIACNVPVIASNAGCLPELVKKHNAGLVFEFNDVESLAEKMLEFAEEPHLTEQLSRGMAPPLTLEAHARALEEVYKSLAKR